MENFKHLIQKISVQTGEIKIEDVQTVLKEMKKLADGFADTNDYKTFCHSILEILWRHMETGFNELDDQLFCSTCFYTVLFYSNEKEYYLKKVLNLLNYELDIKQKRTESCNNTFNIISLAYGIFQSSVLQQKSEEPILVTVLYKIFTLLMFMAYEYSQCTFITFKIISLFRKVIGTDFQNVIFNEDNNLKLLNVINHNWENPITGVRSLNKIIFHNLLLNVDEVVHKTLEQKLNGFYWNKAKYLMLAEIIDLNQSNTKVLLEKYDLVEGLLYSLKKDGLVSAGADMYVAILKNITTDEEWCTVFLNIIIKVIKGSLIKPVDNFLNYWFLSTIKKFPPLSQVIFDSIQELDSGEHKLYSCLRIIQQSNKLGITDKYFKAATHNIKEFVLNNIEHNDVYIRVISFDVICTLERKLLPDEEDYNLILDFLNNNVNSDSYILRINMIKSLRNFLVQLHIAFLKLYHNTHMDCENNNLMSFCKNLQIFIMDSLEFDGNYQRKITTIAITNVMFESFKEIPRKKQKGTKQLNMTLLDFIKIRNQWMLNEKKNILKFITLLKDPSDDVREHVQEVLICNYSAELCKREYIVHLTEEAQTCMRSKFFYQIACAQTIFKLIVNILLMESCNEGVYKNVEEIFYFAFDELKSECNLEVDIVKSIVGGKQLHSSLGILQSIFEVCLEKSYKLNISMTVICSLIKILNNISNQFSWEQETCVSSDFSRMNDMIQKIIENSEYKMCNQDNGTNITGLHQIVLNCLWLNVKTSCELSTILIKYYINNADIDFCEKCLNIICNVLETSRHKGAIEAAGSCLGLAIQQLTSLHSDSMNFRLPMLLLQNKLKQLVLVTNNTASVTRRGAGLSIMIHRIVSSDMTKGKPLFHYFMQTLLETCNNLSEYCHYDDEVSTSNEKDLPKAIYIHFLSKIVIDSSLASDMMYYSGKLAKLAFDNLSSSFWQIRNAALQLYGSLIPKLIGQKKNSGASEAVRATVGVDEFRTHSPKLWEYIVTQLQAATKSHRDIVQCHNNLVPILNLLANLAPVYNFTNEMEYSNNILQSLITLLGSPIYVVRKLTAKCVLNVSTIEVILDILLKASCQTENSLHGTLMLLNLFKKEYNTKGSEEMINTLRSKYKMFILRKCSYLSREQFESSYPDYINMTENMIRETLTELNANINAPGIYLWANFRIKLYLENAAWEKMPQIVTLISECSDFEVYYETLYKRLQVVTFIQEKIVLEIAKSLYVLGIKKRSTIIWRILYELSLHTQLLGKHLDISFVQQYLLNNEVTYTMRYIIAFAAKVGVDNATKELSNIILNFCNPEVDIDMRLISATAIKHLADKLGSLTDSTKINIIKSTILLLQDENEDVRKFSVHFYSKLNIDKTPKHSYICLRSILSRKFFYCIFSNPQPAIEYICTDLMGLLNSSSVKNDDEYNPFTNDSKNIYLEKKVLNNLLCNLKSV